MESGVAHQGAVAGVSGSATFMMMVTNEAGRRGRAAVVLAALATGLLTLLVRWSLVAEAGSAIPHWDQWNGEGLNLYQPWVEGTFSFFDLATAHNEHRLVLTNLWNLFWFEALGGWDPLGQMLVNALLPAITASALVVGLLPLRPGRGWRVAVMVGVLAAMAGPWGRENTLWGFQSQFYFLVMLSLACVAGLQAEPWRVGRWWLGLAAGLVAPLSMSAGALAGAAVTAVGVWKLAAEARPARRASWEMVVIGLALVCWGLCWKVSTPNAAAMQVKSAARWVEATMAALAWPWPGIGGWSLLVFAPAVLIGIIAVVKRRRIEPGVAALWGVAAWSGGAMMAMTWARAVGQGESLVPMSRYLDLLVPGVLACGLLWWWWLPGRAARVGGVVWMVVVVSGLVVQERSFRERTLPWLRHMAADTLAAAQEEIQEKQEGRALFAVRSFPAAGPIGEVLREGAKQAWLPPELTRPPDVLWALNDSLGAVFSADPAAGSAGGWVSPVFDIKSGAVLVLGQGDGRLSIEPANGGGERELTLLMSAEEGWRRWGALVESGSYRVRLRGVAAGAPFRLLWPRPMSTQAYWVRAILGGISERVLAAALLGWGLALGWLWVQPVKRDVSSESE